MKKTRFMEAMFSAVENNDEELTRQVANDIENAKANGTVDTDEVKYEAVGDGTVKITDKETGEVTIAQKASDEAETYDLNPAVPDVQLEKFLHPSADNKPGNQKGSPDEYAEGHLENGAVISPNMPDGGLNPEAGHERKVEEIADAVDDGDDKEFSVSSDNSVVQRIFSDQEYCERLFSEVIESEDTAKVGDLKIEKVPDQEHTIVATDETTGDQAKVTLSDDEMEVTELGTKNLSSKEYSEEEQDNALHVVGVDAGNHTIVDAPEYTQESAEELQRRLTEDGVDAVQIFETPEEARDYAFQLLSTLGAESYDEPQQAEYSDHTIYLTNFDADNTDLMCRMFSEATVGIADTRNNVENAIESGEPAETDNEVITPVDAVTAVVQDKSNGELTKAVVDGTDLKLTHIDEDEADNMTGDESPLEAESDENVKPWEKDDDSCPECDDDDDEKKFSDLYTDDTETKYFSENEEFTDYMLRLFSGDADEDKIADAIENGDQIENDSETITPVDKHTAVVEDKNSDEFTKATLTDSGDVEVHPIDKEEADNLTDGVSIDVDSEEDEPEDDEKIDKVLDSDDDDDDDDDDDEEEEDDDDEEDKDFSDIYTDDTETRYFSEYEDFTDYMMRLYSDASSEQDTLEDAIANGDQIETDKEVITPVDNKTAVVEDKGNGEFTKVTITKDENGINVHPISEDEADNMTEGIQVANEAKDEETGEKQYSEVYAEDPVLDKFFADVAMGQVAQASPQAPVAPVQAVDAYGNPVPAQAQPALPAPDNNQQPVAVDANGNPVQVVPTVEDVEDKAAAAVQAINAAAAEASATIAQAKAAPAPDATQDLQEAQFSDDEDFDEYEELDEKTFSEQPDTLISWMSDIERNKQN